MRFAVIGASGATGRELVLQAASRGHAVLGIDRAGAAGPFPGEVESHVGDLLDSDLAPLIEGCDAVLNAVGLPLGPATTLAPPPLYTQGALNLVRAMRGAEVNRLVTLSAAFVTGAASGPLWFRTSVGLALERVFTQMAEMERLLAATPDIAWTAVRPGWLMDGPATTDYTVTPGHLPRGMLRTRHADLAHFMLDCAEFGDWARATPAIARREALCATTPPALLQEIFGRAPRRTTPHPGATRVSH